MKKLIFPLVLLLTGAIFFGCQPVNKAIKAEETTNETEPVQSANLIDTGQLAKVEAAETKGVDAVIFEDASDLAAFDSIFPNAVKEPGIANMSAPNLYLKVIDTEGYKQNLHLWIGDEGEQASLMREDNTHTIYSLSAEMTEKLAGLVNK